MPSWLIAAGASLLGGVLSRQTAKRERRDHFVNLRDSAQRAGFNPLTVLRATMGGGYEQYAGILSRNPIEGALVAGANAYTSGIRDQQIRAHEFEMQRRRFQHEITLTRLSAAAHEAGVGVKVGDNVFDVAEKNILVSPGHVGPLTRGALQGVSLDRIAQTSDGKVVADQMNTFWETYAMPDGKVRWMTKAQDLSEALYQSIVLGAQESYDGFLELYGRTGIQPFLNRTIRGVPKGFKTVAEGGNLEQFQSQRKQYRPTAETRRYLNPNPNYGQ